jgi:DNA invertase Pin-like site-specific DNA recombinase
MTDKPFEVITHRGGHSQLIGYARVSRSDQELRGQLDALKKAGCSRVYAERVSSVARRLGFEAMLEHVRKADVVVVTRLDRIGRRLAEVVSCVSELGERGVHVKALAQSLDTSAPGGKIMMALWAALAETEREILRERTREGLEAARARGKVGGRRLLLTPEKKAQVRFLRGQGYSIGEIAAAVHHGQTSVRRALELDDQVDKRQLTITGA